MARRNEHENELLTKVGQAVTRRRLELGLSQEELASKADLHRTYISDVERGARNVSVLTLARLAEALRMRLALSSSGSSNALQTGGIVIELVPDH